MGKRGEGKNIVFGVCDEMCSIMEQRGWLERVADGAMPGCWQPTDAGREAIMAMLRVEVRVTLAMLKGNGRRPGQSTMARIAHDHG